MTNTMEKPAITQFPIHDLLKTRWSPRAFSSQPIEPENIQSLFEAARWASSCFNEQPWHFLLATIDTPAAHRQMVSCLVEGNQAWAKHAPLLVLTVAKIAFAHNGKPNRHAFHDIGLAVGNLVVQATAQGLVVHQMAGILPDRIKSIYAVPEGFEPLTGLAIGYSGDPNSLPEPLRTRELAPRERNPLPDFVFSDTWGQPSRLFGSDGDSR
ncbi:MAG: nitroreductase family protein [Nitrospirales bacterium]|nr:nitroreductase family protein [Nitrospirales bacterium]